MRWRILLLECDIACKECTGPTPFNCTECTKGFKREDDDNECKGKAKYELKMVWLVSPDIDECESEKIDCLETEYCNNIQGGYECVG